MSRTWASCRPEFRFRALSGELTRLVESQEQVATNALVDSAEEQAILEELIDAAKPAERAGTAHLDYLLKTPFRYPPLEHGSRFGTRFEPAIFYGSLRLETALAECAFYRFVFWTGMARPPPGGRLVTQHTAFRAKYRTRRGVRLHAPPFASFEHELASPVSYTETQRLGSELRKAGAEVCEYLSARDEGKGVNVAIFAPAGLAPPYKALDQQAWTCTTTPERVSFLGLADRKARDFPYAGFLVAGRFPMPPP